MKSSRKTVSIIVPCLHSPVVGDTLESLREQTYGLEGVEIIVVGMDRYGLIQQDDRIEFLETPHPVCAAAARNLGIGQARGEILAFLDADCIAAKDWLERLVACYEEANVFAVTGGVGFPTKGYWTLCDNVSTFYSYHTTAPRGTRDYAPTLNFSLRREVLDDVGLFDESFPGAAGEDIDFTLRIRLAGYSLVFEPSVLVYHHPARNSFTGLIQRSFRFGRNMLKVFWRYRDRRQLPFVHRHAFLLFALAPFSACGVTLKIFLSNLHLLRYWYTAPSVFLAKLVWRFGGAYQIRMTDPKAPSECAGRSALPN